MAVTKEQFAIWSFERDKEVGLYPKDLPFECLPKDEQEAYVSEAEFYLGKPQAEWPDDILQRL